MYSQLRRALRLSPRIFVQLPDRVQRPDPGFGRVEWVLARGLCHFKLIDLSHVPLRERARALSLQVGQFSPYVDGDHYALWQDGRALVWYWGRGSIQRSMREAGLAPERVRVLPESVLYARGTSELRLIRNLVGVEGQFWRDSCLLQSRWWKDVPSAAAWLEFQRDLGLSGEARQAEAPPPLRLELQNEPQLGSNGGGGEIANWRDERVIYALLILTLSVPTAWIGAKLIKADLARRAVLDLTAKLEDSAMPQMKAREQALRAAARAQALRNLDPYPNQLELMARVAGSLPKGATYLKEWDFRDGKLKIVLVMQNDAFSSRALVGALQKAGGFENVQAAPGTDPKVLAINMDVAGASAVPHA